MGTVGICMLDLKSHVSPGGSQLGFETREPRAAAAIGPQGAAGSCPGYSARALQGMGADGSERFKETQQGTPREAAGSAPAPGLLQSNVLRASRR